MVNGIIRLCLIQKIEEESCKVYYFTVPKLEEIHLPESLVKINMCTFENNNLTEVYIPKNVKTIIADAFDKNPLRKITIPSGIEIKWYRKYDDVWNKFCLYYLDKRQKGGTYVFDGNSWVYEAEVNYER